MRVEGVAELLSEVKSRTYSRTRPRIAQFGAWASEQSQELARREDLSARVAEVERAFEGRDVPCPPPWGGILVVPSRIESWASRAHRRLRERDVYVRGEYGWSFGHLHPGRNPRPGPRCSA